MLVDQAVIGVTIELEIADIGGAPSGEFVDVMSMGARRIGVAAHANHGRDL